MIKEKMFPVAIFILFASFVVTPVAQAQSANGASCLQAIDCASDYCDQTDPQSGTYGTCQPNPLTSTNIGVSAQTSNTGGSGFTALAPIPGLTDKTNTSVVNSDSLANFFNNLYKYLIGLAAVLAVIMIIWGGLEISTKDSVSKQSDGRARIYNAIFGLVLVLSPVLVFSIINPSILNLSINLPPLDTKSSQPVQVETKTLPICALGNRPPNCIPAAPTRESNSATPTPGLWCFQRKVLDDPSAPDTFTCAATKTLCENLYQGVIRYYTLSAVTSSCYLR